MTSWWDAFLTTIKHPIGTMQAIVAPGDPRGIPTTAGGAIADTMAEISGGLSSEQQLRIMLDSQERNAQAQGPSVYGNFLKLKNDLESYYKLSGTPANDTAGTPEAPPDLTNSPYKVLILLGALVIAFWLLRG